MRRFSSRDSMPNIWPCRTRFSRPVALGSTDERCPTTPIELRTRSGWRRTSWPATLALPVVGFDSVDRMRTVVDLPAPLGPRSPKIEPGSTVRLTPSSARMSPGYTLTRSLASMPAGGDV